MISSTFSAASIELTILPENTVIILLEIFVTTVGLASVFSRFGSTALIVNIDPICFDFFISGMNSVADAINFEKLVMFGWVITPLFNNGIYDSVTTATTLTMYQATSDSSLGSYEVVGQYTGTLFYKTKSNLYY